MNAPTLRKVKAGGLTAGIITLATAAIAQFVVPHFGEPMGQALVALVSALIVWGITHGVTWALRETHATEYAEQVYEALGLEDSHGAGLDDDAELVADVDPDDEEPDPAVPDLVRPE
ncbi:MAG: hypothetical protein ACRDO8_12855 [Nocardioidaceae bacterium]